MGHIGCHVSMAGGVEKVPPRAAELGAEAIQIFTGSQRQWKVKPISKERSARFRKELDQTDVRSVITHTSYLINLCNSDPEGLEKSRQALADELERSHSLGIEVVVHHPGSYKDRDLNWGIEMIATSLDDVFSRLEAGNRSRIALEVMAGQGTNIGSGFDELAEIRDLVTEKARVVVCLDTQHMFAAGHDIRTADGWAETMDYFETEIGTDLIEAVHMNDSREPLNSRKDRHANIGQGEMGLEAFRAIVNDPRLRDVPMCIETPGPQEQWQNDMDLLRSLRDESEAP